MSFFLIHLDSIIKILTAFLFLSAILIKVHNTFTPNTLRIFIVIDLKISASKKTIFYWQLALLELYWHSTLTLNTILNDRYP